MSQPTDFHLQDRVIVRHHGREVEGWIRMKTLSPERPVYAVQLGDYRDGELVLGLTAEKLRPAPDKRSSVAVLVAREMPPVPERYEV